MLQFFMRHFSRLTSIKTKGRGLENVISLTNEVKFSKRPSTQNSSDPYERESLEISRVFSDKFMRKGRRNVRRQDSQPGNRFIPQNLTNETTSTSTPSNNQVYYQKSDHSFGESANYNFKVEPDEFYEFDKYESLKKNPRFQDLTHEERQYLQELEVKSKLNDPFNTLRTNKARIDPVRDAKQLLRGCAKQEETNETPEYQIEMIGETEETNILDQRLIEQNKFDEVVSRIRTKLRMEKKEKSEINKLRIPNANGVVVDPIKRHVLRRAARIGTMLHTHIEQLFTCNKPEFLYKHLNGASITINHVEMPTSKSTVKCYYNIISRHDPKQVQRDLDLVAPKVRFMIARKLELGYTPPVKFIRYNRNDFVEVRRKAQLLEQAFNLPLEVGKKTKSASLGDENEGDEYDRIVIDNHQITPEMGKAMQTSFHRRYCGYP